MALAATAKGLIFTTSAQSLHQNLSRAQRTSIFYSVDFSKEATEGGLCALLSVKKYPFHTEYDALEFSEGRGRDLVNAFIDRPALHPVILSTKLVFGVSRLYRYFEGSWSQYRPGVIHELIWDACKSKSNPQDIHFSNTNIGVLLGTLIEHPEYCGTASTTVRAYVFGARLP